MGISRLVCFVAACDEAVNILQAPILLSWHTSITSLTGQVIPAEQQVSGSLSLSGRYRSYQALATFITQYDISSVNVSPFVSGTTLPSRIVVTHSDDGVNFELAQEFDVNTRDSGVQTFTFDSIVRTQYLRFEAFVDAEHIGAVFTAQACPLRESLTSLPVLTCF